MQAVRPPYPEMGNTGISGSAIVANYAYLAFLTLSLPGSGRTVHPDGGAQPPDNGRSRSQQRKTSQGYRYPPG